MKILLTRTAVITLFVVSFLFQSAQTAIGDDYETWACERNCEGECFRQHYSCSLVCVVTIWRVFSCADSCEVKFGYCQRFCELRCNPMYK